MTSKRNASTAVKVAIHMKLIIKTRNAAIKNGHVQKKLKTSVAV